MKNVLRPGNELLLSEALHRMLNSYALAAGAAGVGLLALAKPSAAEIVYTKTHQVIGPNSSYNIDFTHDGTTDLTIQNKKSHWCFESCGSHGSLAAVLPGTNEVVYNVYGAVAMKSRMKIGSGDAFKGGTERMVSAYNLNSFPSRSWVNVSDRYLGVKFNINGETHYGWARLSVRAVSLTTYTATLTGYAYETIPNKSIIAGQTKGTKGTDDSAESPDSTSGTLGRLALGKK
jgi:hypothetical protein